MSLNFGDNSPFFLVKHTVVSVCFNVGLIVDRDYVLGLV